MDVHLPAWLRAVAVLSAIGATTVGVVIDGRGFALNIAASLAAFSSAILLAAPILARSGPRAQGSHLVALNNLQVTVSRLLAQRPSTDEQWDETLDELRAHMAELSNNPPEMVRSALAIWPVFAARMQEAYFEPGTGWNDADRELITGMQVLIAGPRSVIERRLGLTPVSRHNGDSGWGQRRRLRGSVMVMRDDDSRILNSLDNMATVTSFGPFKARRWVRRPDDLAGVDVEELRRGLSSSPIVRFSDFAYGAQWHGVPPAHWRYVFDVEPRIRVANPDVRAIGSRDGAGLYVAQYGPPFASDPLGRWLRGWAALAVSRLRK